MSTSKSPPSSSHTQVPLLLPAELRDTVLNGAAEIVIEHGARSRCFLHIHSEEERAAAVKEASDPTDVTRRAHERWLTELREARSVLWGDARIRRFVRHRHHLVWPSHEHLARVTAVVGQLLLCDETNSTAALAQASEIARATQVLAREATQPGLHLLTSSALPGEGVLYRVDQTRKRERDAAAPSMPSLLTRQDGVPVEKSAWIAEVRAVSHSVSGVLQLQLAVNALKRVVGLLQPPAPSAPSAPAAAAAAAPALDGVQVRQQWKTLVERHRSLAEYQSLFADVAETCRSWGAAEAHIAQRVSAAIEQGRTVQLRTGVHASVVHRPQLLLLVSARPRKLEGVTAAEQRAVEAAMAACEAASLTGSSWEQWVEEGVVRFVQLPLMETKTSGDAALAALESSIRQSFLSPALSELPIAACCSASAPLTLSTDTHLVVLTIPFNPYVVVHGSRVEGGFVGDVAYFHALQRERDRLVEERQYEQLRRGNLDVASRATGAGGAGSGTVSKATPATGPTTPAGRQPTSGMTGDAANYLFKSSLVSALTTSALSKAELQQHPAMQQFRGESNFDALLNAKLKEVAEFKGRKYHLRN